MPTLQRRQLRRDLGREWLRDTIVSNTNRSQGVLHVIDTRLADTTFTAEALYTRNWGRLFHSTNVATACDFRVATFNWASGAFVSGAVEATSVPSGAEYEMHKLLSPTDKDTALDQTIRTLRVRREIAFDSVDGLHIYSLTGLLGGAYVLTDPRTHVLNAYVYADPTASLNRAKRSLGHWAVVETGSGTELHVSPALGASQQLAIDAILAVTLGASEVATINLPDAEWVLAGAAARSYWLIEQRAPGQEAERYRERRREAASRFTSLSARHAPAIERDLRGAFDDPVGISPAGWGWE